jgi:hypothetical protein
LSCEDEHDIASDTRISLRGVPHTSEKESTAEKGRCFMTAQEDKVASATVAEASALSAFQARLLMKKGGMPARESVYH